MKNYKVKIQIFDKEDKCNIIAESTLIEQETIDKMYELHGVSVLDEAYRMMMKEIENK